MSNIQSSLEKIFQKHRVVFWYDEQEKLREQFDAFQQEDTEKRVVQGNEFAIKYAVLREMPGRKFLLYFPNSEPPLQENWLLDIQLAHKVFHTDEAAMFVQELELDFYFKDLVSAHIEFFRSKERRAKLKELLAGQENEQAIRFRMLAVVFKTSHASLEAYIQSYASAFLQGDDQMEKDLERFELQEFFWRGLHRKFDYHAEQPSIYDFLLEVFARNFSLTNAGRSVKETRILLSLWKDARSYQKVFRQLSHRIAEDLKVKSLLQDAAPEELLQDDLFQEIDRKLIYELATRLLDDSVSLEKLLSDIKARENKYWYEDFKDFYSCLEHAGQLFDKINRIAGVPISTVEEAAREYAADWYQVDYHYRKFIYHHRQTGQDRVLHPLSEKVQKIYTNSWLLDLNNKLQDRINPMEQWLQQSARAQSGFFQHHVTPFTTKPQRLFVVISDALRYENGWQLYQEIQSEKRYDATLEYMITGLPSYTQLGMAALLPHEQLQIDPSSCNVLADGILTTGIQGRTKVLEKESGVRAVAIKAEDFVKMNAHTEGRGFVKEYDLIYIYHNRIDDVGDNTTSEDKVFEAVEEEIVFLKEILRKIANVNGYNIFITADHGYIYQHEVLEESEFTVADVQGEVWKKTRRFILGKKLEASAALKHFSGKAVRLNEDLDVLVTKGINRLRVKGAGSRYVHGGASLQEIVVPLIKVSRKKEDTTSVVEVDIIKSTDRITTNILAVSFLQKELISGKLLPRQLRAFFKAEDGTKLSDIFTYTFDAAEGSERQRELKHRFQLSSLASSTYKNQRVTLLLEEPVDSSSRWKEYKSYYYTLSLLYGDEFDF